MKKYLKFILTLATLATGLFHEYLASIFCGILGLLFLTMTRKKAIFYCNMASISILLMVFMYLITCIYAVDAGMGIIGFCRILTILFFLCCTMQLDEPEREELLDVVPALGSIMTLAGVLSLGIKPLYSILYVAKRYGGSFQYPNVYALFCLLGFILVVGRTKQFGKRQGIQAFLLMLGILMSGSRTVFLLLVFTCLVLLRQKKQLCKVILTMSVILLAGSVTYVFITKDMQNIGRFFTISLNSSTLLGRILYMKDGIKILCQKPLGLGYLGYYFVEKSIQTGIYQIRYVHNSFLQIALDTGVISGLLVLGSFCKSIFSPRIENWKRLLLLVTMVHCMVDFDLEFISMWFVILLCLDIYYGKEVNIAAGGSKAWYKILAGFAAVLSLYIGIGMIPKYMGNWELTAVLVPFDSENKQELLRKTEDSKKAEEMAIELLKQNCYITEAYDVLAVTSYQKGEYRKMAVYKEQSVNLQKYDMQVYERYVILLSQAVEQAEVEGDMDTAVWLLQKAAKVTEKLQKVERETDELAYEIKDVPSFQLNEQVEKYIQQAVCLLEDVNFEGEKEEAQ